MNAPIRYFGGKGTMYKTILANFPKERDYTCYVEPFSGTYTVGLHAEYIPPVEVFNDLERNVYTLYKVLRDEKEFERFHKMVQLTPFAEDCMEESRERLLRDDLTDVERAYHFFTANRLRHNGIGGFSVNLVIRRHSSKSVSDYLSAIERLEDLHDRLKHVLVYNRDALEIMDKYDAKECLLYCDPPYEWSTRGSTRYKVDNDSEWHRRFVSKCISSKSRILVSGYDCAEYAPLTEAGFRKVSFEVTTIDGNLKPTKRTECLWRNYDI